MKKNVIIFLFLLLISMSSYGQNANFMINPYITPQYDVNGEFIYGINGSIDQNHFTGEYLIFFENLYWNNYSYNGLDLYYKIETLSFPFSPPCVAGGDCISSNLRGLCPLTGNLTNFTLQGYTLLIL